MQIRNKSMPQLSGLDMMVTKWSLAVIFTVFALHIPCQLATHSKEGDADVDVSFHEGRDIHHHDASKQVDPSAHEYMPKDKILLSQVKSLTFQRNKRTTSRRTHSIAQLSCVGGTAGCKMFTTDMVECENLGSPDHKTTHINQINWRCRADISERVRFKHVEVICEGYDYPEDDYILLGSCGLEFTLDYANPQDYHDNSYFKHMDEHDKQLHHERTRKKQADGDQHQLGSPTELLTQNYYYTLGALISFVVAAGLVILLVRFRLRMAANKRLAGEARQQSGGGGGGGGAAAGLVSHNRANLRKAPPRSYGPLTSAVMTTKKAC